MLMNKFVKEHLAPKMIKAHTILAETPKELPPIVGDYIENVRIAKAEIKNLDIHEREMHSGWATVDMITPIQDSTATLLLAKELVETTGLPLFVLLNFDLVINHDPSQMKWFVNGAKPITITDHDGNMWTTTEGTLLAYGGVREKWWSMNDVDLPHHAIPPNTNISGGYSVTIVGEEYEFTENME
tara:strand:- start:674 stop:1228 length:555 start_codon:yes stop_codon:yes gene_type:complete